MNYLQKKKLAFMSIVNRVKGFVRTVTGVLPLTLANCVDEDSIIDYTLYGQSVQNGTPTPETPVEVESVGEKTRNIWYPSVDTVTKNGITATRNNDNTYTVNGTATAECYLHIGKITIEVGTTYYLSGGTSQAPIAFQLREGSTGVDTLYNHGGITTFSPTGECSVDIINCVIVVRSGVEVNNVIVKPMISLENTDEYEPYGYKIPIKVSGNGKTVTTNIYLDEPLRKIGNYADCIDFENSKIIRKIKCIELKKATDKYTYTGKNGANFADILDGKYSRNQKALCNRNMNWFIGNSNEMWIGADNTYLYWIGILDYLGFTTITELNEWLYDNPTYVFYASNSPSETPITLPKIPSFKGTTILSAETTIQPNNIEITYYSILKE